MKAGKNILKHINWFLPLLLFPQLLLAQHIDQGTYREHAFYYIGSFDFGAGFGRIDHLNPNAQSTTSGGIDADLSFKILKDHNYIKARASTYSFIKSVGVPPAHFDTYDLLIGRQLPVSRLCAFNLGAGVSYVNNYYTGDPILANNGYGTYIIAGYSSVRASAIGLPIELQYSFTGTGAVGSTITYAINLNDREFVSSLTLGFIIGKLHERARNK